MIDAMMCGEMSAKEYLSQAHRIDQRIDAKLEQVSALRALATKASCTLSDMPRSDSPNVCRMEDIIIKIVDSENEINAEIDRLVDLKREMRVVIGAVSQPDYQTLLELRYLCFKTWEQIAVSMGYSIFTAFMNWHFGKFAFRPILRGNVIE